MQTEAARIGDGSPTAQDCLCIDFVTETYPPEINRAACTVAQLVRRLRARKHEVQPIRPRQGGAGRAGVDAGTREVLMGGPIPCYSDLRMGLPATGALLRRWTARRPDIVHIATEAPLGGSALRAARRLRLPVSSDFRTSFHACSRHYGIGWLRRPIMAYLRGFHDRAHCTMVPTERPKRSLAEHGFRNLVVLARRWLEAQCPEAHLAGMRTGEDLAAHYASGDLFVFPSTTETFGNVTPEAMASGAAGERSIGTEGHG